MHKAITTFTTLAFLACSAMGGAQAQSHNVLLSTIAPRDGYKVQWLLPERSVRLYRPGLVIVLRPGVVEYEVNNRVEFADAPPQYVNGDFLVSSQLAARLARLASMAHPSPRTHTVGAISTERYPQASGAITLTARPQAGNEAIFVSGHAPSSAPITITLLATLSEDLPTVVVSRHDVQPDANGQFQATIPIAPDYLRNSMLRVLATSAAGSTPASVTLLIGAPNSGVTVPAEQEPHRVR
jgi:hypothetical protein